MPYKARLLSCIILLANGSLGAMPNEFAKQKGLSLVSWPGRNELRETSYEIIAGNCQPH